MKSPPDFDWREFACGWGAAFFNITISYPMNKVIFRQMILGVKATSAYHEIRSEGFMCLYRGILPPLCQKTVSMSLMFGVYEECRRPLMELEVNEYVAKTTAAIVAGNIEAILMPFERVQALLVDPSYNERFKNTKHIALHIAKRYGYREFYRGIVPILYRNGPSNALYFIMRDESHALLPRRENAAAQSAQEFVVGASIGAFLSTLYYPLNVVKFAMQTRLGGPSQGMLDAFAQIYRERDRKVRNFYLGASMNCTRAFISWGIVTAAYELLHEVLY